MMQIGRSHVDISQISSHEAWALRAAMEMESSLRLVAKMTSTAVSFLGFAVNSKSRSLRNHLTSFQISLARSLRAQHPCEASDIAETMKKTPNVWNDAICTQTHFGCSTLTFILYFIFVLSVRIFVHFLGFYFFVFCFGSKTLLKMLLCIQDYQEIRATN